MSDGVSRWFRENRAFFALLAAVLLVKVFSVAAYYPSRDYFTRFIVDTQDENLSADVLALRESYSDGVFELLGYRFDSVHYVSIARGGYFHEKYFAFAPGYPLLLRVVSWFGLGEIAGGVLLSNFFHLLSIFLFYRVSLFYLREDESFLAATLFAFFPYSFVSGTLAYSEPVFVSFSLLSWIMLERKRYGWCGAMVFLASVVRFQGVFLYLIYSLLVLWRGGWRFSPETAGRLFELDFSVLFFIYWIFVLIPSHGVSYNLIQETYWEGGLRHPLSSLFYLLDNMAYVGHALFFVAFMLVASLLSYCVRPELAFYSLVLVLFYSSFTGIKAAALPRYLGTVWPAFLYAGRKIKNMFLRYYLEYYVVALFILISVYFLLLQMNWMFVC